MKLVKILIASILMLMVYTSPAYAEYTYQLLSPPGALVTNAWGINNSDKVVGWAYDESWAIFSYEYDMKKGRYTILGYDFVAMEISNTGLMVGNPGATPWKCAIRDKKGDITLLYPPSWDDEVSVCDARGVNPDGKVSGFVTDETGVWWGFIYDPEYDAFEEFLPSSRTIGHAINAQGQQAGSQGPYGYVREPNGSVNHFMIDGSFLDITRGRGISENGLMSGFYINPATFEFTGFVTSLPEGDGFESIVLADDEIVHVRPCNPDVQSPPEGYEVLSDVFLSQVRNDGVAVGLCDDWYVNWVTDDWIWLGSYGLIATPVK